MMCIANILIALFFAQRHIKQCESYRLFSGSSDENQIQIYLKESGRDGGEKKRESKSTERQRTDEQMLSDRCSRPSLVCGQQI